MGQVMSAIQSPNQAAVAAAAAAAEQGENASPPINENRGRKRRHSADNEDADDENPENISNSTPLQKRIASTSQYIYSKLFLDGTGSDVTIVALGRDWHLHRVYLCQADYFASMFNGPWKESESQRVEIDIVDENITEEALSTVFGSLYSDVLKLAPTEVPGVLAGASMFRLENLLLEVCGFMLETLKSSTVCTYHEAARMYGLSDIKTRLDDWLLLNLMQSMSVEFFRNLGAELLKHLLRDVDLFVLQVETDIYTLLKQWVFVQLNPDVDCEFGKLLTLSDQYFRTMHEEDPEHRALLETEAGSKYSDVFQCLRLHHLSGDAYSCQRLEKDKIFPKSWLNNMYRKQWLMVVNSELSTDTGLAGVSNEWFFAHAMRYGRVLPQANAEYCWRWVGYTFGLDLVAAYKQRRVSIRRNTAKYPCMRSIHVHPEARHIEIRVRAIWQQEDENDHVRVYDEESGRLGFQLSNDEECTVLDVPENAVFPLFISFQVAFSGDVPDA
ncbi:germ cell-less protein-like 1 [Sycon ciliatum]|uniref:germ cell-less protein-like 1 n=1 Tax=Sycon ciliatum TaxID=27933 RepID=UPI0031F667A0